MNFLKNTSIKKKQTLIVMATCAVALLIACFSFALYNIVAYKNKLQNDLATDAKLVGSNSSAAIDFGDPKTATEILAGLAVKPNIEGACIYTNKGEVFAVYQNKNLAAFTPPEWQKAGSYFGQDFRLFQPIERQGEVIGTVYVQSNLNDLNDQISSYLIIALVVFSISGLIAFVLCEYLQRIISGPILSLVNTARKVTLNRDYSVRALKENEDELGVLIDVFNDMLQQIQERDSALQQSQAKLERRVMERTSELADSLSLVNATLESTTDGILAISNANMVTAYNQQFARIFNTPADLPIGYSSRALWEEYTVPLLVDPEIKTERLHKIKAHPEQESFDIWEFKNGQVFEIYSKPQKIDAQYIGRVWSFREVTEKRRAEEEMQTLHRQLLETSRQAGMAEVATSVLHNVGNVLNSVNVSASLVAGRMKKSKSANLGKIVEMLKAHEADLGHFLTQDAKGKQIPAYLEQLAGNLASEQELTIDELTQLQTNVEHIKEIVMMQQNYAKLSGFVEKVSLRDMLEDALRMNEGALQRHGVRVVREYDEVRPIDLEKNKILQILVNLIRNSKYACGEIPQEDKVITLRIVQEGEIVKLMVQDNGVGIPPENLDRIFNHGFTTRKEGHGFGLHSSALAAKEMGGSLNVFSAGLGTGATFTLTLPYSHA